MKHNTTAIGRPSRAPQTLLALLGLGLTASVAVAATTPPNIRADGSCSASASASIVNMNDGTTTNSGSSSPCSETWSNSAIKQTTSGSATASSDLSGASGNYMASAEYGRLSIATGGSAGAGSMSSFNQTGSGSAGGSGNAEASFVDLLVIDSNSTATAASVNIVVSGMSNVSGYTLYSAAGYALGPWNTSTSFEVLLNGTSIYAASTVGQYVFWDSFSAPISFAFVATASDRIEVIGTVQSQSPASASGSFYSDSGYLLGAAELSINIDISGGPGRLTSASGHNYASAIAPIPEPSTWALMVLGLGIMCGRKRIDRRNANGLSACALALTVCAPTAHAASLLADGDCRGSVHYERSVHDNTGMLESTSVEIDQGCSKVSSATSERQTSTGQASAYFRPNTSSSGTYTASAGYGNLHASAATTAYSDDLLTMFSGADGQVIQAHSYNTGESSAVASFSDSLTLDATGGAQRSSDVLVYATVDPGQWSSTEKVQFGKASLDVRLNGVSVYAFNESSWGLQQRPWALAVAITLEADDVLDVSAKIESLGMVTADMMYFYGPTSHETSMQVNVNSLTPTARLLTASGHVYTNPSMSSYAMMNAAAYNFVNLIQPVPEPSTWALMAVGLLALGASSARRRKTPALNAAT